MPSILPLAEAPAATPQSARPADGLEPVLALENLSVAYHEAGHPAPEVDGASGLPSDPSLPDRKAHLAVDAVSLTVGRGECLGIVGESGAGKSQAFLAALGLLSAAARVSGRVRLEGQDLLALPERDLDRIRGARVGMVFQDPMTSLTPHLRIGDQVAEPLIRHRGASGREARRRALELLERARLADAARRMRQYPHELSGGMRQRVMIAIALACEPQLLILDEPTTALDVTLQAQILQLLVGIKRERGMALVLITHDFGAVAGLADRVAVMRAGRLIELGTAREVMKTPREPYTRALLSPLAGERTCGGERPQPPEAQAPPVPPVLDLTDLSVRFTVERGWGRRGAWRALDAIRLRIEAGEAVGVVGESGCGKSTLARAALHLIRPAAGRVVWMGRAPEGLPGREIRGLRRQLQIIFQDPLASLDPHLTVQRIVAEPLEIHCPELDARARHERVQQMLLRVGLDGRFLARRPHELSGGQCQRVGIARAMILEPRLLVCDEPLSALDVGTQAQVLSLLAHWRTGQGTALLYVSHNLASVRHLCDRVLVLYLGRMAELAPARQLFDHPLHPYTRELLAAIPVPDPDVQPGRLARVHLGEPPAPLDLPTGCLFRTRCPLASAVCAERPPVWEQSGDGRWVACHHFREAGA